MLMSNNGDRSDTLPNDACTGYALVAFDLDDTLAPSKSPLPARMAVELRRLLEVSQVAVISGGRFGQFESQLLAGLGGTPEELARLHLLPTCGTRYLRFVEGSWQTLYEHNLTASERTRTLAALEGEARRLGLWEEHHWGDILEDRGSQVTFSALGQSAPLEAKRAWDPTGEKKAALRDAVAARVPDLEVRSGGSTSVDVTRKGVDKAYGIAALSEQTGIPIARMLFVGDRLDPDGNDFPVTRLGIATHAVTGWEDTAEFVRSYVDRVQENKNDR